MAKKRKTKAHKKLADQRHVFQHQYTPPVFEIDPSPTINTSSTETTAYPYLAKDLTKTVLISSVIVAAQLLLFLILKNNIITIPGITY
jgi:hypothetical protein